MSLRGQLAGGESRHESPATLLNGGCLGALRTLEIWVALRCPGRELCCPGYGTGVVLGSLCSPATAAQVATLLRTTAPSISLGTATAEELHGELDASLCPLLKLLCASV